MKILISPGHDKCKIREWFREQDFSAHEQITRPLPNIWVIEITEQKVKQNNKHA